MFTLHKSNGYTYFIQNCSVVMHLRVSVMTINLSGYWIMKMLRFIKNKTNYPMSNISEMFDLIKAGPLRYTTYKLTKDKIPEYSIWFVTLQSFWLWIFISKDVCQQVNIVWKKNSGAQWAQNGTIIRIIGLPHSKLSYVGWYVEGDLNFY